MELCFNEMTVMKNGTLPEDIALCAQAGFSAVSCRLCAATGSLWSMSATARRAPRSRRSARESYWPGEATLP